MYVTATEFKLNLGKYLDMITKEDIFITKNGKPIAKLVTPTQSVVEELRGIIPVSIDLDSDKEAIRNARVSRYENIN